MTINTSSILQNSLKYGLYLGGLFIAISVIVYITGINLFSIPMGIVSFILNIGLFILLFYLAAKAYRENFNQGNLSFIEGFLVCMATGIIAAIVNAIYSYIFHAFIDPGYMAEMVNKFMESMSEKNLPEDQLDMIYQKMQEATNKSPLLLSLDSIKGLGITSIVLSLIVAAFTKKRNLEAIFQEDNKVENQ